MSIQADPELPIIHMQGLRRDAPAAPSRAHRPGAVRPLGRARRHGRPHRALGCPHRGQLALRGQLRGEDHAGREAWLSSGMETGVNQGYAKLDAMLAVGEV